MDLYNTIIEASKNFTDKEYELNIRPHFPIAEDIIKKKSFVPNEFKYNGNNYLSKEYLEKISEYCNTGLNYETLDKLFQNKEFVETVIFRYEKRKNPQFIIRVITYAKECNYKPQEKSIDGYRKLLNIVHNHLKINTNELKPIKNYEINLTYEDIVSIMSVKGEIEKIDLEKCNIITLAEAYFSVKDYKSNEMVSGAITYMDAQENTQDMNKLLTYLSTEYKKPGSEELKKWFNEHEQYYDSIKTFRSQIQEAVPKNMSMTDLTTSNSKNKLPDRRE